MLDNFGFDSKLAVAGQVHTADTSDTSGQILMHIFRFMNAFRYENSVFTPLFQPDLARGTNFGISAESHWNLLDLLSIFSYANVNNKVYFRPNRKKSHKTRSSWIFTKEPWIRVFDGIQWVKKCTFFQVNTQ